MPTVEKLESLGLGEYSYIVKDRLKKDKKKETAKAGATAAAKGGKA